MTVYKEFKMGSGSGPFGFLGPLLILAIFFTALFFLAKGIFWLLSIVAPILLVITLILDYTVVTDFLKFLWKIINDNIFIGILAVLLVVFGYAFVAGYLFFKALGKRTIKKAFEQSRKKENVFTEYEEVKEDESFLELPPLPKKQAHSERKNNYDDMFK